MEALCILYPANQLSPALSLQESRILLKSQPLILRKPVCSEKAILNSCQWRFSQLYFALSLSTTLLAFLLHKISFASCSILILTRSALIQSDESHSQTNIRAISSYQILVPEIPLACSIIYQLFLIVGEGKKRVLKNFMRWEKVWYESIWTFYDLYWWSWYR
jgi:hypothetical protein